MHKNWELLWEQNTADLTSLEHFGQQDKTKLSTALEQY